MAILKFRRYWGFRFLLATLWVCSSIRANLAFADGPILRVSPPQNIVQPILTGVVGQKIHIALTSEESGLNNVVTLTARKSPLAAEYALGKARSVSVNSAIQDYLARIKTFMKNALSGHTQSEAMDIVTDMGQAPLIKILLPKQSNVMIGKPYRLTLVALPDPEGNQMIIESHQPLPKNIQLGKPHLNADGNWVTELVWTPRPTQVGLHHLTLQAQFQGNGPLWSRRQSQYDMDIEVTDRAGSSHQVRSLQIDQAQLKLAEPEKIQFNVTGRITGKKASVKLSELTATLYDSQKGTIIATDIPVNADGDFTYSTLMQVNAYIPNFIQVAAANKVSFVRRIKFSPRDSGSYLVSEGYPATSEVEAAFNLYAGEQVISPVEHDFLGPDPITGNIDYNTYHSKASLTIYDSLTHAHVLALYFLKRLTLNDLSAIWDVYAFLDNKSLDGSIYGQPPQPVQLRFDSQGSLICVALQCNQADATPSTTFDYAGTFGAIRIDEKAKPIRLRLDFKNSTQMPLLFFVYFVEVR